MSKNQGGAPFLRFGWLKGFAFSLLSIFAVALIHSMVAELARKLGWDQFLVYLMGPPVGTFLSYLVGQPWFWLLAGFSIGVFVGNWKARFRAKQTASQEPQIEGVQAPAHPPLPAVELQPNGEVTISHPSNRDVVQPGYVAFEGTHNLDETREKKGHFWLLTQAAGKYWPQTEITLHPDGRWQESISVGDMEGPRTSVVLLAIVTDFTHALLRDIKDRSGRANYHDPVNMDPPKDQFLVLNKVVLQIPAPPQSANQESEWRQKQFDSLIEVIPNLVDASYLRQAEQQIQDSLAEAELGAAFGDSFKQTFVSGQETQELLNAVSNDMKNYRMILPENVKQLVFGLANTVKETQKKQGEIFRQTVRTKMPITLSQWIFADAFKRKDLELLKAAKNLGIDSYALKSTRFKNVAKLLQELI